MPELPRGTVTFLFTDIEGSTQLQRRLGDRYQGVVENHRQLLEESFAAHGGSVVDRQTESFFAVFSRARDAVGAAVQAQRSIADHDWPEGDQPRVRMGIHAGEPELSGDRYVGLAVSRAARICAAGHGGQVLLSSSARSLLTDDDRASLRNLGSYRLKDFAAPESISQIEIDGLPSKFPPLRAQRATRRRKGLAAVGLAVVAGAIAAAVVTLTGGSSASLTIGPMSVGVIDPQTSKVVGEIELGFTSSLIAAGERYVWVADPKGSLLVKIDPRTREIVGRSAIPLGTGAVPVGLAAGEGAVWVAVLQGERQLVLKLGPELGLPQGEIPFGEQGSAFAPSHVRPLAVGGGAVWAIDASVGALWRIDPETDRASRKGDEGLDALSLAVGGGAVWIAGSSTVTKVDAVTGQPLGENPVDVSFGETSSVALGEGDVWFTASGDTKLWQIDAATNRTADTFGVGKGPSGVDAGEGAVWVACSGDGTVWRVDATGGGEPTTIELGSPPGGVVAAYGAVWTSPGEPRG